jgi:hypothetical protein
VSALSAEESCCEKGLKSFFADLMNSETGTRDGRKRWEEEMAWVKRGRGVGKHSCLLGARAFLQLVSVLFRTSAAGLQAVFPRKKKLLTSQPFLRGP